MKLQKLFKVILPLLVIIELVIISKIIANSKINKLSQSNQIILAENKKIVFNETGGAYFLKAGTNEEDMQNNTKNLQMAVNAVSENGGGTVILPSGTYYFKYSDTEQQILNGKSSEHYVIKCKNNVTIIGQGREGQNATILKPYGDVEYGGIDMFFFNNYRFGISENETLYLENAHFRNFAIDGENANGGYYNTSGKGFMINLFKNCTWNNILVQNTDATGFGMDCPIESSITNCIAINCGKKAQKTDGGASGFGIGTGYSNEEGIFVYNCEAYGNTKYGFFFEHQSRFRAETSAKRYDATESKNGFVVSNCIAGDNRFDFGGERAYDVTYENCTSINNTGIYEDKKKKVISSMHFENFSVRTHVVNFKSEKLFTDLNIDSNGDKPVWWAISKGILEGAGESNFGKLDVINRATAVELLYRMDERKSEVFKYIINNDNKVETGFQDVDGTKEYAKAIRWGVEKGIVKGNSEGIFSPTDSCTRADFVLFLYRYAGSPDVAVKNYFTDVDSNAYYAKAVTWAYENDIVNGSSEKIFSPDEDCTKLMAITMIYRYEQANTNKNCNITYNLQGGTVAGNPETYCSGKDSFILNNPTKDGYVFEGWTGSSIEKEGYNKNIVPSKVAEIKTTDKGSKTYTAHWSCEHNWKEATCETAKTCERCGKTEGEALGHSWKGATCEAAKTCERCGKTEGEALGHSWKEATCETAKTCERCGETEGEALGHSWKGATCEASKTCERCGKTEGEALGHSWKEATCETAKTCERCGKTEGEALGHSWKEATCEEPKTCKRCGKVEGKALGHSWKEATCEEPRTCTRCGTIEGVAKGHIEVIDQAEEATCTKTGLTEGKHCVVCNKVIVKQKEIPALGHDYKSVVTKPTTSSQGYTTHTCTRCGDSYKDSYTPPIEEPENLYVASSVYNVGDKYISKIKTETTVKVIKEELSTKATTNATEIEINSNSIILKDTDTIGTGMKISFKLREEIKVYTLIVSGDVNGDGKSNFLDIVSMNKHRLGKKLLSEEGKVAGDVVLDGKVDFKDITKVNKFRLNKIKEF